MRKALPLAAAALLATSALTAQAQPAPGMKMPRGFSVVVGPPTTPAHRTDASATCVAVVVAANESQSRYPMVPGRSFGRYETRAAGYEALRRGGWTCPAGTALCTFRIPCTDERLPATIPPAP